MKRVEGRVHGSVGPALPYASEARTPKRPHVEKPELAEMTTSRFVRDVTKKCRVRNVRIRGAPKVCNISAQGRGFIWFGHCERRGVEYVDQGDGGGRTDNWKTENEMAPLHK